METLLNLTFAELIGRGAGIILVASIFVEITPVKFNPVSSFLSWVGKKANTELMKKVSELDNKVNQLENGLKDMQDGNCEREAINCRIRILSFGNELRRGLKHSEESFNQVLEDIDDYDRYCLEHKDFKNNKTVATKERILEEFDMCMKKNDFI